MKKFFKIVLCLLPYFSLIGQGDTCSIRNKFSLNIVSGLNFTTHYNDKQPSANYNDEPFVDYCIGVGIANYFGSKRNISLYSTFRYDRFSYRRPEYIGHYPNYSTITSSGYYRFIGLNESLLFNLINKRKMRHALGFGILLHNLVDNNDIYSNQVVVFCGFCYNFQFWISKFLSLSITPNVKYTLKYLNYSYIAPGSGKIETHRTIFGGGIEIWINYFLK